MKTVKRYTSFEDLKSGENKPRDIKASVERHNAFEKIIKAIYSKSNKNPVRPSR